MKDANGRLELLLVAREQGKSEGTGGKAQCVILADSCVICGNGVATAVYVCPVILSCYPAPWAAAPRTHAHISLPVDKAR